MSFSEFSYEQTRIMRDAVELVVRLLDRGEDRREEIAKLVLLMVGQTPFDATALANLTLSEMTGMARKTG
jgi:hypothetical protein